VNSTEIQRYVLLHDFMLWSNLLLTKKMYFDSFFAADLSGFRVLLLSFLSRIANCGISACKTLVYLVV